MYVGGPAAAFRYASPHKPRSGSTVRKGTDRTEPKLPQSGPRRVRVALPLEPSMPHERQSPHGVRTGCPATHRIRVSPSQLPLGGVSAQRSTS